MSAQKKMVKFQDIIGFDWERGDTDVSLDDVIKEFEDLRDTSHPGTCLRVVQSYDDITFYLVGERMETQDEADVREAKEIKDAARAVTIKSRKLAKLKIELAKLTDADLEELLS